MVIVFKPGGFPSLFVLLCCDLVVLALRKEVCEGGKARGDELPKQFSG